MKLVGIFLFDNVEVLDFAGPFEVFSLAGLTVEDSYKVITIARKEKIVARNGLEITPDFVEGQNIPHINVLVVPGGIGTQTEVNDQQTLNLIKNLALSAENVLSVCTGVSLLGKCGLIDDLIVTTHHLRFEQVQQHCKNTKLCKCRRFTDSGKFLTSAGISAGIDLSFYFVKRTLGADVANKVAIRMEYLWKDLELEKCCCVFENLKNYPVLKMQSHQIETPSKCLLGILLFDEVEVLDVAGPFEVFSITGNMFEGSFKVVTIAEKRTIQARNGLKIIPNFVFGEDEIPKLDVLIIPGGNGTIQEVKNDKLMNWVKSVEPSVKNVLSICTGVSILGKCGFISGMIVTTHRQCFDFVQLDCPDSKLCKCQRFTDNGKFMTSGGISAGIDLSFYFVKKHLGSKAAIEVGERMEYDWRDLDITACTCTFD